MKYLIMEGQQVEKDIQQVGSNGIGRGGSLLVATVTASMLFESCQGGVDLNEKPEPVKYKEISRSVEEQDFLRLVDEVNERLTHQSLDADMNVILNWFVYKIEPHIVIEYMNRAIDRGHQGTKYDMNTTEYVAWAREANGDTFSAAILEFLRDRKVHLFRHGNASTGFCVMAYGNQEAEYPIKNNPYLRSIYGEREEYISVVVLDPKFDQFFEKSGLGGHTNLMIGTPLIPHMFRGTYSTLADESAHHLYYEKYNLPRYIRGNTNISVPGEYGLNIVNHREVSEMDSMFAGISDLLQLENPKELIDYLAVMLLNIGTINPVVSNWQPTQYRTGAILLHNILSQWLGLEYNTLLKNTLFNGAWRGVSGGRQDVQMSSSNPRLLEVATTIWNLINAKGRAEFYELLIEKGEKMHALVEAIK